MRKSISEIKEIAKQRIDNNISRYKICENCNNYRAFTDEEERKLRVIFGDDFPCRCGICNYSKMPHNEPVIVYGGTEKTDASIITGDQDCFEFDSYAYSEIVQSEYDLIEQDYWE